jgi:6,7-dimethyl-8-ribityllumazine synthase
MTNINLPNIAMYKCLTIAAQANDFVVSKLIDGTIRACYSYGLKEEQLHIVRVAGALEIPLALNQAANIHGFNVYVVLGAIIKGKTDHYAHVSRVAHDGIMSVALEKNLALGNGILTVYNLEQALERADGPSGNLGYDAARAALNLRANFFELSESKYTQ